MEINLDDKNTAEYVVSEFFKCWVDKDFDKARQYTQRTWRLGKSKEALKELLGRYNLMEFCLYGKEVITDCRHEVIFRAELLEGNMYGKANVIRETEPYTPSPSGVWGVNPISIISRWNKDNAI